MDGQGLLVDQKARPGAQSLKGQPPLLEIKSSRKDRNHQSQTPTCCRKRREGSHVMVICSSSVEYSIGQTKYGTCTGRSGCYPTSSHLAHEIGETDAHDDSGQPSSNETLPGLFRTQLSIDGQSLFG